tara:strand:+ start:1230 stop:2984 length:1755 start_codon:yes stop_codon:yes gene_type:complete
MVLDNIYKDFKLPLHFVNGKTELKKHVLADLEINETLNPENKSVYERLFLTKTQLGDECKKEWTKYFSTDKTFLKESQKLYKKAGDIDIDKSIINNMLDARNEMKAETDFLYKYQYLEWDRLKWLNHSSIFLYILSFYNISSPLINLIAPLFILIIPFILLKLMRIPISVEAYTKILIRQLKTHSIGRLFFSFGSMDMKQKVYAIFCIGMYIYNLYQNVISCYKFYNNIDFITNQFDILNNYFNHTLENMHKISSKIEKYSSYSVFKFKLDGYIKRIEHFKNIINELPKPNDKFNQIKKIGVLLKYFYTLYDNDEIEEILNYSFGFNGYIECILGIHENIKNKNISKIKFAKNKTTKNKKAGKEKNYTKLKFKNIYHPSLIDNAIKNNINIKNNMIITGPNAAGKTTIIKSIIINLILSQQIGYGYYDSGEISIYDHIHCYINIPDSCSRDSLFQSEARRCKDILDAINENKDKKHFCIFDELYSGTNPYEAISAACGYLENLSNNNNVKFILTTHFIRLCKLFINSDDVGNFNMETIIDDGKIKYKYKIQNGISEIKGGMDVLRQLKYPTKIIKRANIILREL